jgi:hypothetical protein
MNCVKNQVMINNAHLNNQTTVTISTVSKKAALQSNVQQPKSLNTRKVEVLAQYQTAIENGTMEHQILSQRGYNKGYRGF